ncbi:MAG: HupE/UreJ family protein [Parvularculaceae bacterium]|nr:HupE/UreJ family protein [Parvularculaceae bacterium]
MRRALISLAFFAALPTAADAHDSRPLFVEMSELAGSRVKMEWTAPPSVDRANIPVLALGAPCAELARSSSGRARQTAMYDCELAGAELAIEWPVFNPSISTLVRVNFADGETRTEILDPSKNSWRAPAPESFAGVSESYFRLGVSHIFGGIDHLLFLAGLLAIAGTPRRTLVTVTGFTLAHSLTLALVALGILRVSIAATEAVIALSIVFLATEIARADKSTLTWRRPVLVASAFGLAHGAGFAAALGEIGLPKTETLAALLFFNMGVEAGQVAAIACAFTAVMLARRAAALSPAKIGSATVQRIASYGLGIIAGYWFIERIAVLFAI